MAELIDREATYEVLTSFYHHKTDIQHNALREALNKVPSVEAEPVRYGHWIIKDNPGTGWYRVTCSQCGEDVTSVAPVIGFFPKAKVIWDFCPECGARMDGE